MVYHLDIYKMKRSLIILFFLLFYSYSKGQTYPITSNLGGPTTRVTIPNYGALNGGIIPLTFSDTSSANAALTYGKNYNGFIIYTQTPQATWWRLADSSKWVMILPQGGGTPLSGQAWINPGNSNLFTDASLNGGFGTLGNNGVYFKTNGITRLYLDRNGIAPETGTSVGIGIDPADSNRITYFSGGGGSTPTWQQTLTAGSTLTGSNTITGGGFDFTWNNAAGWLINATNDIALTNNTGTATSQMGLGDGNATLTVSNLGVHGSEIHVNVDTIKLYPGKGILIIDTLNNETFTNTLMGWTSTAGADRGKVGYITLGSGLSLGSGVLDYAYANKRNIEYIETNTFTALTGYTAVGSPTYSVTGGKVAFTGAGTGSVSNITQYIRNDLGVLDECNTLQGTVTLDAAPDANSYGVSIGFKTYTTYGTTQSLTAGIVTATGANFGKPYIYSAYSATVYYGTANTDLNNGDVIRLSLITTGWTLRLLVQNFTQGWEENLDLPNVGGFNPLTHNGSYPSFFHNGGNVSLDSFKYTINAPLTTDILFLGNSITYGQAATKVDKRWVNLVGNTDNNVMSGGGSEVTADFITRLPELVAINPARVILHDLAGNDIAQAISSATWQANLITIRNTLNAAGIQVIWTNGQPRTGLDLTAQKTFIEGEPTFAGDMIIDTWAAMLGSGTNPLAAYMSDATHPNDLGMAATANAINTALGFPTDIGLRLGVNTAFSDIGTGSIYGNASYGLTLRGRTGAVADLTWFDVAGNAVLWIPTGTYDVATQGKFGAGLMGSSITAWADIAAATTSLASIRIRDGVAPSSPNAGDIWKTTDKFYGVINTGTATKEFTLNDIALTSGRVPYTTTNGRLTDVSTFTFGSGLLSVPQIKGSGSTPSIAGGAGAGTTPTVSITGTDLAGEITVTTDTDPTVSAVFCTITFATAFGTAPYVVIYPSNDNAILDLTKNLGGMYINSTTTTFTINTNSNTAPAASTQLKFHYHVIQ
jgi:hypothetical protein